jgi:mono/diheme cytochrome c family protein
MSHRTRIAETTTTLHMRDNRMWALMTALLFALLAALLSRTAHPGGRADAAVARGEHIARVICSNCHVVASDQEFPPILLVKTPDFSEIANRPGTTAESLQRFIMHTHWDEERIPMTMPNQLLPASDVKAVSRYILSLRKP